MKKINLVLTIFLVAMMILAIWATIVIISSEDSYVNIALKVLPSISGLFFLGKVIVSRIQPIQILFFKRKNRLIQAQSKISCIIDKKGNEEIIPSTAWAKMEFSEGYKLIKAIETDLNIEYRISTPTGFDINLMITENADSIEVQSESIRVTVRDLERFTSEFESIVNSIQSNLKLHSNTFMARFNFGNRNPYLNFYFDKAKLNFDKIQSIRIQYSNIATINKENMEINASSASELRERIRVAIVSLK